MSERVEISRECADAALRAMRFYCTHIPLLGSFAAERRTAERSIQEVVRQIRLADHPEDGDTTEVV